MQQLNLRTSSNGAPVPLEEGGRHTLLCRGMYLMGDLCWSGGGGSVFRVDIVRPENGCIMAAEGGDLGPLEVVAVGGQRRHEAWAAGGIRHGEEWCCAR